MARFVLIANPGTPRCETFRREFQAFHVDRVPAAELIVVPWSEVIRRAGNLDDLPAFDRPAIVRIESPGKCELAYRQMLEVGARDDPSESPFDWLAEPIPRGLIVRPGLWYRGFCAVLAGLRRSFDRRPHLTPSACPLAIAEMFDKNATLARLADNEVPVPEWLPTSRIPNDDFELLTMFADRNWSWPRTYVKLNTGSSARGVVVLDRLPEQNRAVSTLAWHHGRALNTRDVRELSFAEFNQTISFLRVEGATIQRGVPLAQIDGQNFDLRVVCLKGRPIASIFRISPHPMTNLHLGGRRGDFARCRAAIPSRDWLDALDHCVEAADCFDSDIVGVDLVFEPGFRRHAVLEVNAFGDFFPGWTDSGGRSIHSLWMSAIELTA